MDTVWASLDDLVAAVLDGRLHNQLLSRGCSLPGPRVSGMVSPVCAAPIRHGPRTRYSYGVKCWHMAAVRPRNLRGVSTWCDESRSGCGSLVF
jgi:hypothetical protein